MVSDRILISMINPLHLIQYSRGWREVFSWD